MERSYTVSEIDRMRQAVQTLMFYRGEGLEDAKIEDRLRTYMLDGAEPYELYRMVGAAQENWASLQKIAIARECMRLENERIDKLFIPKRPWYAFWV